MVSNDRRRTFLVLETLQALLDTSYVSPCMYDVEMVVTLSHEVVGRTETQFNTNALQPARYLTP
jgi:hypothetical protein